MAICNVFKELTKSNGTFFTFSQYAEDLTKHQSNNSYKVIPSRFICCDVDYSSFGNKTLPNLLQNNFENGCSFLRDELANWTPEISKNLFWNEIGEKLLLSDNSNSIVYCGDINIQSYSEQDNIGYNEIYCYIPNDAKKMKFNFEPKKNTLNTSLKYNKDFICGYDGNDLNFNGLLDIKTVYPFQEDSSFLNGYNYQYNDKYDIDLSSYTYTTDTSFKFNTVVVFYDIYSNGDVKYENIPLGMFVTGLIDDNRKMGGEITKYVSNGDIYDSGTSYGLRICNRFVVSPNSTKLQNTTVINSEEDGDYPALAQVMSAMADSQSKMDEVINSIHNYQDGIKEHLAQFKNSRVNIPYIRYINGVPYWFVNGVNTGQKLYYDFNFGEGDDAIITKTTLIDDKAVVNISHNNFLGVDEPVQVGDNTEKLTLEFGGETTIHIPYLSINKSGHIYNAEDKDITITLPEIPEVASDLMKNDGSNYIESKDLVKHYISSKWKIYNKDNKLISTNTDNDIQVENGANITYEGYWTYESNSETTKSPTNCNGDWGESLKGANFQHEILNQNITSNKTFSQTISAPKSGLEVKNNKIVKASGDDTSKVSASVTFLHKIYYGSSETFINFNEFSLEQIEKLKLTGELKPNKSYDKNVHFGTTPQYFYYLYPTSLGESKWLIDKQNYTCELGTVNITNNYGKTINYLVYRSSLQTGDKNINIS
jgi:hypothetical protein